MERNHFNNNCKEVSKEQARKQWEEFGEAIVKKTLNHSGCTSLQTFRQIAKYYLTQTK